jgi:exportin-7
VQLAELLNVEFYGEWIGLIAEFTTRSLLSWQVCIFFILIV